MATYKAVMSPALEYASSIWSPLASSTSINELQVMQNAALRTATGCTQDTNIQKLHDETLTLAIYEHLQLHASHVVSSSSIYFHFFMLYFLRPIFVRSLLRYLHFDHLPDAPLARDSLGVCISLWSTDCRWMDHILIHRVDGLSISSLLSCMLLDFRRLFGTMWS